MAPSRIAGQKRRRSSIGVAGLQSTRFEAYGSSSSPSPSNTASVTFVPNVTPMSYAAQQAGEEPTIDLSKLVNESANSRPDRPSLFPPPPGQHIYQPAEASASSRKRYPPANRRPSQGYIPRPPNAFILFRQFIIHRGKIPDQLERTQGGMGKIIGNLWRSLTLEERTAWEQRAKEAKEAHKQQYPDYRYAPNHDKNKREQRKKEREERLRRNPAVIQLQAKEDERCQEIASLMMKGLDGRELVEAVKALDERESESPSPAPGTVFVHSTVTEAPSFLGQRRSSSVPPPIAYNSNFGWNAPAPPAFGFPTEHRLSHEERMLLGGRRASSARPYYQHTQPNEFSFGGFIDDSAFSFGDHNLGLGVGETGFETRSASPLPEIPDADTSMFRSDFSFSPAASQMTETPQYTYPGADMGMGINVSPLDGVPPDMDLNTLAEAEKLIAMGLPPLMGPTDSMYASSVASSSPGFPYASPSPYTYESTPASMSVAPNAPADGHAFENVMPIAAPRPRNPNHVWTCAGEQQPQEQPVMEQSMMMQPPQAQQDDAFNFGGFPQSMHFDDFVHSDAFNF